MCVHSTHTDCDYKLEDDDVIEPATLGPVDGVEGTSRHKYHCQWKDAHTLHMTSLHTATATHLSHDIPPHCHGHTPFT